ncbi:MAG: PepSY-associated TM helix domain-containing protein [Acidimicrobiia bacterium]|nr:PepSY-associated TM helix domain-containing protein [Acidimicrobiia bacterium]
MHVYSSMGLLLLVLFFGVTGLTLNHPEWTFGLHATTSTKTGDIPGSARVNGKLDLLALSQYLRKSDGVHGDVSDFGLTSTQGFISYRGPGYAADVTIDVAANTYKLDIQNQGLIGILDDLHRGRATNRAWGWVIDISAGILVLTALAGLSLQLVLRKRRTSALIIAATGGAIASWIAITTLR